MYNAKTTPVQKIRQIDILHTPPMMKKFYIYDYLNNVTD